MRRIIAVTSLVAVVFGAGAAMPRPGFFGSPIRERTVRLAWQARFDGPAGVEVFRIGTAFRVDPSRLVVTAAPANPDGSPSGPFTRLAVDTGNAEIADGIPDGGRQGVTIPLTFARPAKPGLYVLRVDGETGLAHDDTGDVPVDERFADVLGEWHAWFPDERHDAALRDAKARLVGRDVWGFGRFVAQCDALLGRGYRIVSTGTPLHVRSVERLSGMVVALGLGDAAAWTDETPRYFAIDPLVVRYEVLRRTAGGAMVGSAVCEPVTVAADRWDLDRMITPIDSTRAHPEWSKAERERVLSGRVGAGSSRAMVAWALGFPPVWGTVDELDRLETWNYSAPAPFSSSVTFAHDRVVEYQPPGELP